jgi:hypothetical protein
MLYAATEAEGQERASSPAAGASVRASATILPSLDGGSFAGLALDLASADAEAITHRGALLVSAPRASDRATALPTWFDPPVARTFERLDYEGRTTLLHTIAVLY